MLDENKKQEGKVMKNYYVESIVENIAQGIKQLIAKNILTKDKKIVLYGLDTFSFAMRTVLFNLGFLVDSYISDDLDELTRFRRHIKAIRARYLNSSRDLIGMYSLEERLLPFDENILIISGSKNCPIEKINGLHYRENRNFFQVYDWNQNDFIQFVYGKQKMLLQEIQDVEKDILYHVDQFCRDRGLRYWVCGGTLLGTVRHKGFIPWDDDIDIFMPWKDYLKFTDEFTMDEKYELIISGVSDRKDYHELFSKVVDKRTIIREDAGFIRKIHPVAIDVFPLIGLPKEQKERLLFFERYYELEKTIWEDFYAHNGDLSVYNKWYPNQKDFLEKYDFDQSDYVGVLATAYKEKDCTTRKVYDSTLRFTFEDIEVNVPLGYEEYLMNLYGKNWMELPEEGKRVSHHNIEAYWL